MEYLAPTEPILDQQNHTPLHHYRNRVFPKENPEKNQLIKYTKPKQTWHTKLYLIIFFVSKQTHTKVELLANDFLV